MTLIIFPLAITQSQEIWVAGTGKDSIPISNRIPKVWRFPDEEQTILELLEWYEKYKKEKEKSDLKWCWAGTVFFYLELP